MSPEQLAAAIRETDYLKRFDRRTYSKAFQEYTDRFAPMYLELTTGLRRGELLALRWEDLDLEPLCGPGQ